MIQQHQKQKEEEEYKLPSFGGLGETVIAEEREDGFDLPFKESVVCEGEASFQ